MSTLTPELTLVRPRPMRNPLAPLATLARRRFQLTARTPRELAVPLITPILFALVIAPALKEALHTGSAYESFVATGTIGLLIPLNTLFSGLSVIVDRESGAQRELLAAPIPRALVVLGNLVVALFPITALPGFMTWIARFLPLTHALALVRYGLLDDRGALHDIWGMSSTGAMAGLSLLVVAGFAAALTAASIRVFTRSAVG